MGDGLNNVKFVIQNLFIIENNNYMKQILGSLFQCTEKALILTVLSPGLPVSTSACKAVKTGGTRGNHQSH